MLFGLCCNIVLIGFRKKISVLLQQNTNSHWIGSVLYIAKWTKVSNDVLYVHHLLNSWEKCVQISSYILPPNEIQSEWKLYFRNRKDSSGQVYLNGAWQSYLVQESKVLIITPICGWLFWEKESWGWRLCVLPSFMYPRSASFQFHYRT